MKLPEFGLDKATGGLKVGSLRIPLPQSKAGRVAAGTGLVVGGVFGFLPLLGFWMVPVGVVVLSRDIHAVRRQRRRLSVWWNRKKPKTA